MNKFTSVSLGCLLVLGSAGVWAAAADSSAAAPGPFGQLVGDFVFGALALSPTTATGFGYHVHRGASLDDLLDDYSPAAVAASREFARGIEARIAKLDTAALDKEQRADIDMIRDATGASRLELDEIQS